MPNADAATAAALEGLPGSTTDPGEGPAATAALDELLDDGGPLVALASDLGIAAALAAHRAVIADDHRDLLATLVVPTDAAAELSELLTSADLGLRLLLAADGPDALDRLLAARSALVDDDRAEVVGLRLPLPPSAAAAGAPDPADAVHALLAALDATVPAWIVVPPGAPTAALDALAADGAENVTVDLAGDPAAVAVLVRALVDRDLTFRACGARGAVSAATADGAPRRPGVLNALCAVRAALNGAEAPELAAVLTASTPAGLTSAVRRMSDADAAVTRAFLAGVQVDDVAAAIAGLADLGLLPG